MKPMDAQKAAETVVAIVRDVKDLRARLDADAAEWAKVRPVALRAADTAAQLRAARALLGIDQRELAQRSGLSLPTIQRMEASDGVVRGNVDSLMKLVDALAANRIELIGEGATSSTGGRGVRLK